jgi:hypothetical protein
MITNQMMRELTGKAAQERQAQRQANKERVIAEAISMGDKVYGSDPGDLWKRIEIRDKTPEEIRNDMEEGFASWAGDMEEYHMDWLDIPDYETYRDCTRQLYDLTKFADDDTDPRFCRYWDRLRKEHPDCPIIAALADFDQTWDDVASLPAEPGDWEWVRARFEKLPYRIDEDSLSRFDDWPYWTDEIELYAWDCVLWKSLHYAPNEDDEYDPQGNAALEEAIAFIERSGYQLPECGGRPDYSAVCDSQLDDGYVEWMENLPNPCDGCTDEYTECYGQFGRWPECRHHRPDLWRSISHGSETFFYVAAYGSRDRLEGLRNYGYFLWQIADALPQTSWLPNFVEDGATLYLADHQGPVAYFESSIIGEIALFDLVKMIGGILLDLIFVLGSVTYNDEEEPAYAENMEFRSGEIVRSERHDLHGGGSAK